MDKRIGLQDRQDRHCPNCGAPVISEVCPYCGAFTGLNTVDADMMYDSMDVKEGHLNFFSLAFPAVFAGAFGFFGFIFPIFFLDNASKSDAVRVVLCCSPFAATGLVSAIIVVRNVLRCAAIKLRGEVITGTVYGYMDDDIMYNEAPGQKIKILINTKTGPKFILYQLTSPDRPYPVNTQVDLKVYKNICILLGHHRKGNILD